ncbi:hypothetical protein ABPG72_008767 [Tetrahymena utriculariae]
MDICLRRKPFEQAKQNKNEDKKNLHLDDFDLADSDREDYHNNVDILFVLDTTGSMGSYFQPAIDTIKKIVEKFNKMEFNIKFGLCAYRDHPPQEISYVTEFTDLTTSKNLVQVLSKLTAEGGGDGPEAVMDGLREGLKNSSWRLSEDGQTMSKRFLFHICDAPPHGQEYGGYSSDSSWQKNGCPCGTKKEDINNLLKLHKVDYHLIKAVDDVTKMEQVFKKCFEENYAETIDLDLPSNSEKYESEEYLNEDLACYYENEEQICATDDISIQNKSECFKLECDKQLEKSFKVHREIKYAKSKKVDDSQVSQKKQMWEGVISALDKKLI